MKLQFLLTLTATLIAAMLAAGLERIELEPTPSPTAAIAATAPAPRPAPTFTPVSFPRPLPPTPCPIIPGSMLGDCRTTPGPYPAP